MNRIIASNFSSLEHLTDTIVHALDNEGGIIVSNLFESISDVTQIKQELYQLCERIGVVSNHNSDNTPIWDILPCDSESQYSTFSENASEAELHTDSQYRELPEDHFALYCIKKASCGGGLSIFLSVNDVMTELNQTNKGRTLTIFLQIMFILLLFQMCLKSNHKVLQNILSDTCLKMEKCALELTLLKRLLLWMLASVAVNTCAISIS